MADDVGGGGGELSAAGATQLISELHYGLLETDRRIQKLLADQEARDGGLWSEPEALPQEPQSPARGMLSPSELRSFDEMSRCTDRLLAAPAVDPAVQYAAWHDERAVRPPQHRHNAGGLWTDAGNSPEGPSFFRYEDCYRCSVLAAQVAAVSQALAGLGGHLLRLDDVPDALYSALGDLVYRYVQPCRHVHTALDGVWQELRAIGFGEIWGEASVAGGKARSKKPGRKKVAGASETRSSPGAAARGKGGKDDLGTFLETDRPARAAKPGGRTVNPKAQTDDDDGLGFEPPPGSPARGAATSTDDQDETASGQATARGLRGRLWGKKDKQASGPESAASSGSKGWFAR